MYNVIYSFFFYTKTLAPRVFLLRLNFLLFGFLKDLIYLCMPGRARGRAGGATWERFCPPCLPVTWGCLHFRTRRCPLVALEDVREEEGRLLERHLETSPGSYSISSLYAAVC